MANHDMMLQVIPNDFSVDLIWRDGSDALFGALRKGGREVIHAAEGPWETHTCGVWHFVANAPAAAAGPIQRFGIRQWHVPRYAMAAAVHAMRATRGDATNRVEVRPLGEGFTVGIKDSGGVYVRAEGVRDAAIPLPPKMVAGIDADIATFEKARAKVSATGATFLFRGINTAAGHPIEHASRRLVEAIAFEKETLPKLEPGNFGIYSAFCTYRDFPLPKEMPDDLMQTLVGGQWQYDATEIPDDIVAMFLEAQRRLLRRPIWGRGITMSKADASLVLAEGMRSLPMEKRVQFVLMNGMHAAGLFLPLCVLTGCIGFEQYVQYMTQGLPPDAGEEQDRRKHVAFISLYGELAAKERGDEGR